MSQYSRPLGVLVGAPVTFVGPAMAGLFAGALWTGVFWATTGLANASAVMAKMKAFIVTPSLFPSTTFCTFVSIANPELLLLQTAAELRSVWTDECVRPYTTFQASAITSISIVASFGSRATSTVERAGGACLK